MGTVNEPAIRTEEQIISLFPDRETLICRGWVLKRIFTAVIRKNRRIERWIYRMKNVSW